jgi:hypothetical protein
MTIEIEGLENVSQREPEITFVQFRKPLDDDKFFLIRCADDIPIHWMTPNGAWVEFPMDEAEAVAMFESLVDSEDWPVWGFWELEDGEEEA